jgi:hypothetical protein
MTIIEFEITCNEDDKSIDWIGRSGTKNTSVIHYEECNPDDAQISSTKCDWDCSDCANQNNEKVNPIQDLIDATEMYDDAFIERLEKITSDNIYVKINDILSSGDFDVYDKGGICDMIEAERKNTNESIMEYPYVTKFHKQDDRYIATLHISNEVNIDDLYITMNKVDDSWGCSCSVGSFRKNLPVNLSIGYPSVACSKYETFTDVYSYSRDHNGRYHCSDI